MPAGYIEGHSTANFSLRYASIAVPKVRTARLAASDGSQTNDRATALTFQQQIDQAVVADFNIANPGEILDQGLARGQRRPIECHAE